MTITVLKEREYINRYGRDSWQDCLEWRSDIVAEVTIQSESEAETEKHTALLLKADNSGLTYEVYEGDGVSNMGSCFCVNIVITSTTLKSI